MRVLAVLEGNLVVVEPRLETMLRHTNVDSCVTGCGSDSGLVCDIICKARAIRRAKVLLPAIALLVSRGACINLSYDFHIVALDNFCHVVHTAVANFHVISVKYLV